MSDLVDRLPHGPSFRFVDTVEARGPGEWIRGTKTFSGVPLSPVWPFVPEVLLVEALGQIAGLALAPPDGSPPPQGATGGFLAAVGPFTFLRPAPKDCPVTLEARLRTRLGSAAQFDVWASVDGERVAEGRLTLGGLGGAP